MSVRTYISQWVHCLLHPFCCQLLPGTCRREEEHLGFVPFPLRHLSLFHRAQVFVAFPLPEAAAWSALTSVSSWVRSASQSVHTPWRPLGRQCRPLTAPPGVSVSYCCLPGGFGVKYELCIHASLCNPS